jgi:transcriptional regulator with XRE-family HTH domain
MKERLLKFLNTEQLSSARFAEIIGVQPSSVSHILSGRNNPGFDFIQKILSSYPSLNAEWLILGKGNMMKNAGVQGTLFPGNPDEHEGDYKSATAPEIKEQDAGTDLQEEPLAGKVTDVNKNAANMDYKSEFPPGTNVNSVRVIEKIIVLYSDKSFSEYIPS